MTRRADRLGTLTAMPDDERDDDVTSDDGRVISGFGVGSAALGLLSVAAVVLALIIWSGHKSDADERLYQTEVLDAAADWTTVLINMNKDGIDASLQKLHDGTVGELNNEFESVLEPYKKVVQTLQSQDHGGRSTRSRSRPSTTVRRRCPTAGPRPRRPRSPRSRKWSSGPTR